MNSKDYVQNAIRTESVPEKLIIDQIALHALMTMMIACGNAVNQVKRQLYYGKQVPTDNFVRELATVVQMSTNLYHLANNGLVHAQRPVEEMEKLDTADIFKRLDTGKINIRLLHAAMGSFTESAEMVEALLHQYETGELDGVNLAEESGDVFWYHAIAAHELGIGFEETQAKNIAKLRARFPNKFEADKALNRDLGAERTILEGQQ